MAPTAICFLSLHYSYQILQLARYVHRFLLHELLWKRAGAVPSAHDPPEASGATDPAGGDSMRYPSPLKKTIIVVGFNALLLCSACWASQELKAEAAATQLPAVTPGRTRAHPLRRARRQMPQTPPLNKWFFNSIACAGAARPCILCRAGAAGSPCAFLPCGPLQGFCCPEEAGLSPPQ